MSDFSGLSMEGRVVTAGDPDWDQARAAQNLFADQQPAAVALVEGSADVASAVRFAAANGLKVAGQGTGHGAVPLGSLEDAILIKTAAMQKIEIDAGAKTARVEAGVRAGQLAKAAGEKGLCFLPGSAPTVGVTGFCLGGGLSWLGRRHGFACNRVRAIELVTAEGEEKIVDAENDEDLFWALRGGGGAYAIVTALHLDLLEIAEVFAGIVIYPAELGADGIRAFRDWAAHAPDEAGSIVRFIHPPPLPDIPEPIRDKHLLAFIAAFIGSEEEGRELMAPLRELAEPVLDTYAQIPASGLGAIAMDPEDPVPGLGKHVLLTELPDDAIDAYESVTGENAGSPLANAEIRPLGGAFGRTADGAGALDKLDAGFTFYGVGAVMSPEAGDAIDAHIDKVLETMRPWTADGAFLNFTDQACDVDAILPAETCDRLAEVKRRWDPESLIRSNHPVPLAAA